VKAEWLIVDAENQVLGRLASQIAKVIRGKHKPTLPPTPTMVIALL
jgi:large subunit ribosomal protein L13